MQSGNTFTNDYPELSELQYVQTNIDRDYARSYLEKANYSAEIITAALTLMRVESSLINGVNNNYCGIQADCGRWIGYNGWAKNGKFAGVVHKSEKTTGRLRWYLAFDSFESCADFVLDRVKSRGVYFGGFAIPHALVWINSIDSFATAYYKEWVEGSSKLQSAVQDYDNYNDLVSIYNQEYKYFSQSVQKKNQQFSDFVRTATDNTRYNVGFFLFGK